MLVAATARRPSIPASLGVLSVRLSPTYAPNARSAVRRPSPHGRNPLPIMGNPMRTGDPSGQGWPRGRVPGASGGSVERRSERQLVRRHRPAEAVALADVAAELA